jgi:predicted PurR-regulated permease PerM
MNNNQNRVTILLIITLLGVFLFWSLIGFLTSFLSATILYVLARPLMRFLTVKKKWNKTLATFLILLISFVTVLIPFWSLYSLLANKINYAIVHSNDLLEGLKRMDAFILSQTGFSVFSHEMILKFQEFAGNFIPQILGATADALATIVMMYFILYYLLKNQGELEKTLIEFLPFEPSHSQQFSDELEMSVFSNALGAPLLAVLQGIIAGIIYWLCGLDEPWFWGTITGFMSFIPIVGTALVWIPAGIYQYANEAQTEGIAILICGMVIITNIDNVFRFALQKKFANVHPVITVLGVIVGLKWFGIAGIVFGPLLISYFILMVKMYKVEYK